MRVVKVTEELNRDKVLDEAVFLSICGMNQIREGCQITGVVRLEMARDKLDRVIKKINSDIEEMYS